MVAPCFCPCPSKTVPLVATGLYPGSCATQPCRREYHQNWGSGSFEKVGGSLSVTTGPSVRTPPASRYLQPDDKGRNRTGMGRKPEKRLRSQRSQRATTYVQQMCVFSVMIVLLQQSCKSPPLRAAKR